jgi:hypothetical protein
VGDLRGFFRNGQSDCSKPPFRARAPNMPPKAQAEEEEPILLGRFGTSLKMGIVGLPNVGCACLAYPLERGISESKKSFVLVDACVCLCVCVCVRVTEQASLCGAASRPCSTFSPRALCLPRTTPFAPRVRAQRLCGDLKKKMKPLHPFQGSPLTRCRPQRGPRGGPGHALRLPVRQVQASEVSSSEICVFCVLLVVMPHSVTSKAPPAPVTNKRDVQQGPGVSERCGHCRPGQGRSRGPCEWSGSCRSASRSSPHMSRTLASH